jgi:hypothetical protein
MICADQVIQVNGNHPVRQVGWNGAASGYANQAVQVSM